MCWCLIEHRIAQLHQAHSVWLAWRTNYKSRISCRPLAEANDNAMVVRNRAGFQINGKTLRDNFG
jgi:hypothetical protein